MGFATGALNDMSMDEFGFFSEASDQGAPPPSSYSSHPRAMPQVHPSYEYKQYGDQQQTRLPTSIPPYHNDYHQQHQYQPVAPQQQHPHRLKTQHASSDAGSHAGSSRSGIHQSSSVPAKRGSNLACLKCRAIKVKCWKSSPNDPRCARCNRLDLFCEFREHHRGKKLDKVIADENRNVVLSPDMLQRARLNMLRCSSYPLNADLATMISRDSSHDLSQLALPSSAMPMREYGASGSVDMASSVYDDVVRLNMCSWADACYLFSLFSTQLNPIVALLEPSLYTVQYTREHSPILFSVILSIASRFFRPDLHSQCQNASASILKFASSRHLCSIDHIQALIVSNIWAPPGDSVRSEMLNAAVSYAYELGLPFCFESGVIVSSAAKPYTPPMPVHLLHGGHQTTLLRMQQRTWMQLCLLALSHESDTKRTSIQKRPELIAHVNFPDIRAWYELNISTMSAYDARLAYQLDLALSQRSFNRLVASSPTSASSMTEDDLVRTTDELLSQERDCFSSWFNMYGNEYVARYGMDRYSNAEAGYLLLLYKFTRAVQLHSAAAGPQTPPDQAYSQAMKASVSSHLENRWFAAAMELAFKVLEAFIRKILEQDSTSSSMLRISPQYMASGCLSAARWLLSPSQLPQDQQPNARLHSSVVERARERVSEVIRLLAQPQFYPDGNRVPTTHEITGQLDQALRSLVGDGAMLIAFSSGNSPKRARAQKRGDLPSYQGDVHSQGMVGNWQDVQSRNQRRRTSNASLARVDLGSVGGRSVGAMSESAGSERGGSEWSPHLTGEKWSGGGSSGYVSSSEDAASMTVGANLGGSSWPPSLFGMSSTGVVSASTVPEHLNLGLGGGMGHGPYGYASAQATSTSTPSLSLSVSSGSMLPSHHAQGYNEDRDHERSGTTHPYLSGVTAASDSLHDLYRGEPSESSGTVGSLLDASLTVGLSSSYEQPSSGPLDTTHLHQHQGS